MADRWFVVPVATLGLSESELVAVLNGHFGNERSFAEWEQQFISGES